MLNRKNRRGVSKFQVGAALAVAVMGVSTLVQRAKAATVTLQDTNLTLTDPGSYPGSILPTPGVDTVLFTNNLTGAVNSTYTWALGSGSDNSWFGIQILNPGGNINLNDSVNVLTLQAGGIDMSASTRNLTLNMGLSMGNSQTWSINTGTSILVNNTVAMGTSTLYINGGGNLTVNSGGLQGAAANLVFQGTGTMTVGAASTYTGSTTVRTGGVYVLDFSNVNAGLSNLNATNSSMVVGGVGYGGGTFRIQGGASSVSQTYSGFQTGGGLVTVDSPNPGAGFVVALGGLSASTFLNGALMRFDANTTSGTLTTTSNLGGLIRTSGVAQLNTFGLYDFAAVSSGGVISPAASVLTYTAQTTGALATASTLVDITGGSVNLNGNVQYVGIRINTPVAGTINVSNNGQIGGFLMTPNAGAINVVVTGGNLRTTSANNANGGLSFWQNDTAGTLTVSATIGGSNTGFTYEKAGAGLVIFNTGTKNSNGGTFINEGELRFADAAQLGLGNGSAITINGGVLGVGGSFTNSNGTNQHPIIVSLQGGSVNVPGTSTFTITNSANTAISGSGILTKTGTGTLALLNGANSWTGGLVVNNGLVNVSATSGTPTGSGPVSVNSGGSITVTGVMPSGFTINSGGTWDIRNGTINGAVTLNTGALAGGTGTLYSSLTVPSGVTVSPATATTQGTLTFQNITLNSSSILSLNLTAGSTAGDVLNILSGGTLNLGAAVNVGLYYAGSTSPFFSNGTYALFTGVDVVSGGKWTGSATSGALSNLVLTNLGAGASATFSLLNPGTSSTIIVTITGAKVVANWSGAAADSNWATVGNWSPEVPGALIGDTANFPGLTSATQTVNLNAARTLGNLNLDGGTNSAQYTAYTLAAGTGGQLFLNNGTGSNANISVGTGVQTISAPVEFDRPTTISINSTAGYLVMSGALTTNATTSTVSMTGSSKLVLSGNNSITSNGTIAAATTLQLGDGGTTGAWGSGSVTVTGTLAASRSGSFNVSSLAGRIMGAGTLTNAGLGNMVWDNNSTANAFTGTLNAAAGTISVGASSVWTPTGLVIGSAGKFDLNGNNLTFSGLTSAGVITNTSGTPAILNINNAAAATLGGTLTNTGAALTLLKTGAGVLTINGSNSYTGELIVNAGSIASPDTSIAFPAGSLLVLNVTNPSISLTNGSVINANVALGRDASNSFYSWDVPAGNGSVTFNGSMWTGTGSQFRVRMLSSGTATVTGTWAQTNSGLNFFTQGNFLFTGTSSHFYAGNATMSAAIQIGRSEAAGEIDRSTSITLANGAVWQNFSPTGNGVQIGATGQTNANQTLTVDASSILIGTLNFELDGQNAVQTRLNIQNGGTVSAGGFTKTATGTTTVSLNNGIIQFNQAGNYGQSGATNFFTALGTPSGTIVTGGYSIGLNSSFIPASGTSDGGLTFTGGGAIAFAGGTSTYYGDTVLNTSPLYAAGDNAFSPNSIIRFTNSNTFTGNGSYSATVGGLDDTAGTGPGSATGFITLGFGKNNAVAVFGGSVAATNLLKTGSGTQVLTAANWNGNTILNGGRLVIGNATTNGLTISTSGIVYTSTVGGEATFEMILGTAGSGGFTASSLNTRTSGNTANFVVTGGVNGSTNFIKFSGGSFNSMADTYGGYFFGGGDYAFMDTTGYLRAPVYGTDTNTSGADALSSYTHALVTTTDTISFSNTLYTAKLASSAANLNINGGSSLTIAGILKTGGGSSSINGAVADGLSGDLVIRVDTAADNLNMNSLLDSTNGSGTYGGNAMTLTKAGEGTLTLTGTNTFAGKLNILNGTVVAANAGALQNILINLDNAHALPVFGSGITQPTIGGLISTVGSQGTWNLSNADNNPINLTIKIANYDFLPLSGDGFTRINIFNGNLTGSGSLTIVQQNGTTGRMDFNYSNSFTGGVTILSGRVQANQQTLGANSLDQSFGTGPITLTGGSLTTHGSGVAVLFNNNFIFNGDAVLVTPAANATFNGQVSGGGTVTRNINNGTLVFNSTDNSGFTGSFVNLRGAITWNNYSAVGNTAAWNLAGTNATAYQINTVTGGNLNFGTLAGSSASTLTVSMTQTGSTVSTSMNIGSRNENATYAGSIVNNSGNAMTLVKTGTGSLTLLNGTASNFIGINIQSGAVNAGTLDNGVLGTASATSGATLLTNVNTASLAVGMYVVGTGIQQGTTITALSGTTATISTATSAAITAGSLAFENANALGLGTSITVGANATLGYVGAGDSTIRTLSLNAGSILDASGTGAVNYANTTSPTWDTAGVARTVTLTGTGTSQNVLAAALVNNGAGVVQVVKNGTGLWSLNNTTSTYTGGTTVNAGELMLTNATGSAVGTGALVVNATGKLSGNGYVPVATTINANGHLSAGVLSANHAGTLNFTNILTLSSGSILDIDMAGPGFPNDIFNFATNSTLSFPGGVNSIGVNLYNAGQTTAYFFNGTYNIFTNVQTASLAPVNALHVINEPATASGAAFTFSYSGSNILLTVTGAWNNGFWNNNASDNSWTNSTNWIGGVPNGSGNLATFGTIVNGATANSVILSGSKTVNAITFNSTQSYTIAPSSSESLLLAGGSGSGSAIMVTAGTQNITAPISLVGSGVTVQTAANTSIVLNGGISGSGSLGLSGTGVVVLNGTNTYSLGTTIPTGTTLQIGTGGTTGTLASGTVNLTGGTLRYNHTDNVSFDLVNTATGSTGTIAQIGAGTLTLSNTGGSTKQFTGNIQVTNGTIRAGSSLLLNGTQGGANILIDAGKFDVAGTTQDVRNLSVNGVLDNSSGAAAQFNLYSTSAVSWGGTVTNSGGGALAFNKLGTGTITMQGAFNESNSTNNSFTISSGVVNYNSTSSTSMGGLIIMARTTSGSSGLLIGNGINLATPILVSSTQGNIEFVSAVTNVSNALATFSGDVSVDPQYYQDVRIGNFATSGTLTMAGTITIPAQNSALISRGIVALGGTGKIDYLNTNSYNSAFQIGYENTTTNLITTGSSTIYTYTSDTNNTTGIRLGNYGGTAGTSTHTIAQNAFVRVGLNGGSDYDLGSGSVSQNNTLQLNGGSIILGRFVLTGSQNYGNNSGNFATSVQANVNFNGGTVMAGLSNNNMTQDSGSNGAPYNLKYTVQAGGLTLDLNGKQNVTWSHPLTSGSAQGTTFSDGGLTYVSRSAPSTMTLSTKHLYAGKTTIGSGATVIAGSSDVLGNPVAAAALNFDGGVFRMSNSFVLGTVDGGTSNLTHRYSFNDSRQYVGDTSLLDSVTNLTYTGTLNNNATVSGNGVLAMTALANSSASSLLSFTGSDQVGGTYTNYSANGVSFAVWYTPSAQTSNAVLFSLGQNSQLGPQTNAANANMSYFQVTAASGSATGNIRAMLNGGGGEINAQSAQPSTGNAHLVVVTIDGSNLSLFVDGALTQRTALSTLGGGTFLQNLQNGGGVMLGGSQSSSDPSFNGLFDEFRVYNAALDAAAITAMYNSGANTVAAATTTYRDITVTTNGGSLDLAGNTLTAGGNLTNSGTAGTLTLLNGGSLSLVGAGKTLSTTLTGSTSKVSIGGGTTTLTGKILSLGGGLSVDAGSLVISGGTISGTAVTVSAGGTFDMRDAAHLGQVITVPSLTVSGGGTLGFDLGTSTDLINTSSYSFTGGTANVVFGIGSGFDVGEYTVITGAGSSLAGQYSASSLPGFSMTLDTSTSGTLAVIVGTAAYSNLYWRGNNDNNWNNTNWSTVPGLTDNATASPLLPTSVVFNNTGSAVANLASAGYARGLAFSGASATIGGTGNLTLLNGGITVDAVSGPIVINTSGGITLTSDQSFTNNGTNLLSILTSVIGGSLTIAGTGVTLLSGTASSFSTGVSVGSTATARVGSANAFGSGTSVGVAGTLDLNGQALAVGTLTGSGTIMTSSTAASSISTTIATANTFGGQLTGAVSMTKAGAGTLVLTGLNTNTGTVTVSAGQLTVGVANALSATGGLNLSGATSVVDLNGTDVAVTSLAGAGGSTITNSQVAAVNLTASPGTGVASTFAGNIVNGSGTVTLVKSGAGSLVLTGGTGNTFTGGVQVTAGALWVGTYDGGNQNSAALGTGPVSVTGGTLGLGGTGGGVVNYTTSQALTLNGGVLLVGDGYQSLTGPLTVNGTSAIRVNWSGKNAFFSNTLAGSGTLTVTGGPNGSGGEVLMTNVPSGTFAGSLVVDYSSNVGGAIVLGTANLFSASSVIVNSTGNSNIAYGLSFGAGVSSQSFLSLAGSGNVRLQSSDATPLAIALTAGDANNTTFSGVMSGTGSFTKTGTGTLTLTGSNSLSGIITVSSGALELGNGGGNGIATSAATTLNDNALVIFNRNNATTPSYNINGTGAVTQLGSGTLVLTGTNNYSGGTNLIAGVLQLGSAQPIGTAGLITFNGGTMRFTTANTTDYSARFSTAASQQFKFDTNSQVVTLANALSSTGGSLTKSGLGTLILTAANSFGDTTISGGELRTTGSGRIGTGNVSNAGTLTLNHTGTQSVGGVAGAGTINTLSGTTVISGAGTFTGPLNISSGATVQVGAAGSMSGTGTVANAGTLDFANTAAISVPKTITGAGTLSQSGAGVTTLGNYQGTGNVSVAAGTLAFAPTNAVRQTSGVAIQIANLSMGSSSVLDMTNHDLLIGNTTYAAVQDQILAAFGAVVGPAITTSTSNVLGSGVENTLPIPIDATAFSLTEWDGVTLTQPNTVIVKYTIFGDATLDGSVNGDDFSVIAGNFGMSTPGAADIVTAWLMGDVTLDGVVNGDDFSVIAGNFGQGPMGGLETVVEAPAVSASPAIGGTSAVPEPTTLSLLALGSAGMLLRRKRRKS